MDNNISSSLSVSMEFLDLSDATEEERLDALAIIHSNPNGIELPVCFKSSSCAPTSSSHPASHASSFNSSRTPSPCSHELNLHDVHTLSLSHSSSQSPHSSHSGASIPTSVTSTRESSHLSLPLGIVHPTTHADSQQQQQQASPLMHATQQGQQWVSDMNDAIHVPVCGQPYTIYQQTPHSYYPPNATTYAHHHYFPLSNGGVNVSPIPAGITVSPKDMSKMRAGLIMNANGKQHQVKSEIRTPFFPSPQMSAILDPSRQASTLANMEVTMSNQQSQQAIPSAGYPYVNFSPGPPFLPNPHAPPFSGQIVYFQGPQPGTFFPCYAPNVMAQMTPQVNQQMSATGDVNMSVNMNESLMTQQMHYNNVKFEQHQQQVPINNTSNIKREINGDESENDECMQQENVTSKCSNDVGEDNLSSKHSSDEHVDEIIHDGDVEDNDDGNSESSEIDTKQDTIHDNQKARHLQFGDFNSEELDMQVNVEICEQKNINAIENVAKEVNVNINETSHHHSNISSHNDSHSQLRATSQASPSLTTDNENQDSKVNLSDTKPTTSAPSNDVNTDQGKSWASLFKANAPSSSSVLSSVPYHSHLNDHHNLNSHELINNSVNSNSEQHDQQSSYFHHAQVSSIPMSKDSFAPMIASKLKKITLKHSIAYLKPNGFINRGNWCYINATLQALLACPPFFNLMSDLSEAYGIFRDDSSTPIIDSFTKFFSLYQPLKRPKAHLTAEDFQRIDPIEPKCIYDVLAHIKMECIKGRQEDAEEFLSFVLNGLHEEMIALFKLADSKINAPMNGDITANGHAKAIGNGDLDEGLTDDDDDENMWREVGSRHKALRTRTAKFESSPISDIFGGSMVAVISEQDSQRRGNRQPFFALQLDIQSDKVRTLADALKHFNASETLQDFKTSKTKQVADAMKQTFLDTLPPILIIHLKLFVYDMDGGCRKILKRIDYPIDLELPKEIIHQNESVENRKYKLLNVVYHDGKEAVKGHYITDVYHIGSGSWLRCDDATIKVIPNNKVLTSESPRTPYLLFYRRQDTMKHNISAKSQKH